MRTIGLVLMIACSPAEPEVDPGLTTAQPTTVASPSSLVGPWQNRLMTAQSPYLRMHGEDPVDWYAWGQDAFEEARRRNVPIFLSIGYYACHWCHVMHQESFKDAQIAAYLNENFVAIKVDREERPDIDALYMDAVHILNRNNGGWPASIWMTPDGKPFFAGTYFPPVERQGRPGFRTILERISSDWKSKPENISAFAEKTGARLIKRAENKGGGAIPSDVADTAVTHLASAWSPENRGFGTRQQFPMASNLQFLLWYSALRGEPESASIVKAQLQAMDQGGIHDQIGGGFHRYTVDPQWVVPHFEKMLYDNAQLLSVYAEASVEFNHPRFAQVSRSIANYLMERMQDSQGGFYSAQSADSGGEEGAFYLWTPEEIRSVLADSADFEAVYAITAGGNYEGGRTVLTRRPGTDPDTSAVRTARQRLQQARDQREPPPTDHKLVVAWNGLTIGSLARASRLLGEPEMLAAAQKAAGRVLEKVSDGRIPRLVSDTPTLGVLEDYAFLGNGLLDLYEADHNPRWLLAADDIARTMVARFHEPETGAFYQSDSDVVLLARKTESRDGAEPSGPGLALRLLTRLRSLGSPSSSLSIIEDGLKHAGWMLERSPSTAVSIVDVADRISRKSTEVVIATARLDDPVLSAMLSHYNTKVRPHTTLAVLTPEATSALEKFSAIVGKTTTAEGSPQAYVCHDGVCQRPTGEVDQFVAQLAARP